MNFFATPEEAMQEDAQRRERWKHLTEGVESFSRRYALEQALENHANIMSRRQPGVKVLETGTTTGNIANFDTLARPILRGIYHSTILADIASIQPMRLPTWRLFYLDFKYGTSYTPTVAGDKDDYTGGTWNHLYPNGAIRGEAVGTGDGSTVAFQLDFYPIVETSLVVNVDASPVAVSSVDQATGVVTLSAAPAGAAAITADYDLVMEGLGADGNASIPDMYLDMSSGDVSADSWKLKAQWTIEAQQDIQAYHNLNIAAEMTQAQARQIRLSIDRIGINNMLNGATAGNVSWSQDPGTTPVKEYNETLVHAINDASLLIHQKRLRWANFVVMAPETMNRLDKTQTFRLTIGSDGDRATILDGPNVFGTLANRYSVIVDPQFPSDKILVGYKGSDWQDTGYVWSPYVTFMTDIFIDPNTMKPVQGMMERGAHHLVNGDFYATVTITA